MARTYNTIKRFHYNEEIGHYIKTHCKKKTSKQIADHFGCSRNTIEKYARMIGASFVKRGENFYHAKLSNNDVELIRQLKDAGVKQRDIAEKFDVSQACISQIVNFKERCYDF